MEGKDLNRKRVEKIQNEMRQQELDALVVFKPQHSFYISQFNPVIQSTPVIPIVPAEGEASLLVSGLRAKHALKDSSIKNIQIYGKPWLGLKSMAKGYLEAVARIVEENGWSKGRIGVEKKYLSVYEYDNIKKSLPNVDLVDSSPLFYKMRLVKDEHEIECVRTAAALANRGMEAALETLKEGVTEQEIVVQAQNAMNSMWVNELPHIEVAGFATKEGSVMNELWAYSLSGPRWDMFCDSPTSRVIQSGDLVFIFTGGICNGYHAENERTIAVGKISEEQKKVFDTVLKARENAMEKLRPGNSCSEVYQAAADVFVKAGYGGALPGRIGHGLGIGAHEEPSLGLGVELLLEPGMILTIEPSMRIGDLGGTQHSDTVLITSNGFEFLTDTDRGFLTA